MGFGTWQIGCTQPYGAKKKKQISHMLISTIVNHGFRKPSLENLEFFNIQTRQGSHS